MGTKALPLRYQLQLYWFATISLLLALTTAVGLMQPPPTPEQPVQPVALRTDEGSAGPHAQKGET